MLPRRLPRLHAALAATVLSALVSLAPGVASADSKIAVVDVQQAVMQTEDGIRAQGTLKKLFDKRQKELDAKQEELQRAREDIERQARVLSREALSRRMEDWQRRMVELQTSFVDYNKELQKKQGDLTGPILRKMMGIITRLAKKSGYELILDRSATPYARPDLDLTEQVVQMYNSGGDGGGDAPPEGGGDKPSGGGDEKK
ncbi:OmpH family outer membrane protein [Polyangium sp. 6x1]|uniref:OmpH family outer membrane protein n=1 Tax=Polyangium sp. 6x1 TaxID=3042689 RepID=UPI0024826B41|nr:OmpH family outer membrane protein [Polyangium sp. 6x1]MDI1448624.1 OmpH family outer membrane protein [Polyangium sp. 6x1]